MTRLNRQFFAREATTVARDLLGRTLVHTLDGALIAGKIVEAEAYTGWDDQASHAHRGQTPRNAAMFGDPGISYVYLIYGMYWLLNVVARPPGVDYPAAVLIRALEPLEGLQHMAAHRAGRPQKQWTSGPGKLTIALGVDGSLDGIDLADPASPLFFEAGQPVDAIEVSVGPRIGLGSVAEPWRSKPWRFWISPSPYVSR